MTENDGQWERGLIERLAGDNLGDQTHLLGFRGRNPPTSRGQVEAACKAD